MNPRTNKYKNITLFMSPERFKADLAFIRARYRLGSDNPLVNKVAEEDKRIGAEYVIRAKK